MPVTAVSEPRTADQATELISEGPGCRVVVALQTERADQHAERGHGQIERARGGANWNLDREIVRHHVEQV